MRPGAGPPGAPGHAGHLARFAGAALAAAALTVAEGPRSAPVLLAVGAALIPWVVLLRSVSLPPVLFSGWSLAPVVYLVAVQGNGASMFLATVAVSWVASRTSDRRVVVPVTMAGASVIFLYPGYEPGAHGELLGGAAYFAFGVVFGALVGTQLRRQTVLTGQLRAAQEELARGAAATERRRIARDVHDIVGHSLTVVVLHVAGARRLIARDPAAAENALLEAERVGRTSLDAMRDVVGLLRDDGPAPSAGLGDGSTYDVRGVVEAFQEAGGLVDLRLEGDPAGLPATAQATLYRFVQEALTNAGRHGAPNTAATVSVRISREAVVAEARNAIIDRRAAGVQSWSAPGHGLEGMKERVSALGGELTAGRSNGEWIVSCRVPLAAGPAI